MTSVARSMPLRIASCSARLTGASPATPTQASGSSAWIASPIARSLATSSRSLSTSPVENPVCRIIICTRPFLLTSSPGSLLLVSAFVELGPQRVGCFNWFRRRVVERDEQRVGRELRVIDLCAQRVARGLEIGDIGKQPAIWPMRTGARRHNAPSNVMLATIPGPSASARSRASTAARRRLSGWSDSTATIAVPITRARCSIARRSCTDRADCGNRYEKSARIPIRAATSPATTANAIDASTIGQRCARSTPHSDGPQRPDSRRHHSRWFRLVRAQRSFFDHERRSTAGSFVAVVERIRTMRFMIIVKATKDSGSG